MGNRDRSSWQVIRDRVSAQRLRRLELALGMVLGIESFIALRDIYGADPGEIREVWRWVCKAMVRSALNQKRLATRGNNTTRRAP